MTNIEEIGILVEEIVEVEINNRCFMFLFQVNLAFNINENTQTYELEINECGEIDLLRY